MSYLIYAKGPKDKTFKAMDWANGYRVDNLIYATLIPEHMKDRAIEALNNSADMNKGHEFQLRTGTGKGVHKSRQK